MNPRLLSGIAKSFLSLLLITPLLLSCSSSAQTRKTPQPKEEAPAVINFVASEYSSQTRPLLEGLVQDFMLKNPDIVINLQVANWDILDIIYTTMISKNQPPDLLNTNVYTHFANNGLLNDMDEIFSPELKAQFYPDLLERSNWKGKQYGIPFVSSVRKLYYNKELFRDAGIASPPQTWSELKEDARKIKNTGKARGFGVDLTDNEIQAYLSYFFIGAGGGWIKDGTWTINSPENVEGLTFLKEMYMEGLTDSDPSVTTRDEKQRVLGDGKLGMMISGNYFAKVVPREFPGLEFDKGPIPVKDGVKPINFGVQDLLVSFKTDHTNKQALSKFLDYLYSNPVYEQIIQEEGFLPVTKLTGERLGSANEDMKADLAALRTASFYPIGQPEWQAVMDTARKLGEAVLHDRLSPKQALDDLQQFAETEQKRLLLLHKQ
ncbi:extracellular solute-binding protein [Paenibacillus donghaensis]|uniref:extracellular solute-binding protein n=1 Tax=Paenibacillus donghaensis TaxID=414771 RepID=UPI0018840D0A|nr:extracellular solute-binding protein [Paenibacillus donghaensis]MBE9915586.1 extracellular solute-binding protein [Paenibacillus donghaensis]